jgi:hypothetical protein
MSFATYEVFMVSLMQSVSLSYVPLASCTKCSQPLLQFPLGCRVVIVHPAVDGKIEHAFHYYCLKSWLKKSHTCDSCMSALIQSNEAPPPSSHKRIDESAREFRDFFDAVVDGDEATALGLVRKNPGLYIFYKTNALRLAEFYQCPSLAKELSK